jgi:hypothetical protein
MNHGLSDQVRVLAKATYVVPAVSQGKQPFSIAVKDLIRDLEGKGFPRNHARQVCKALTSGKFLRDNEIRIDAVDGPPSKTSTTVVVHYRFATSSDIGEGPPARNGSSVSDPDESPEEWAHRMTGKLQGLMKDEIAAMGGGEAFLRWVRGYDEEEAQ